MNQYKNIIEIVLNFTTRKKVIKIKIRSCDFGSPGAMIGPKAGVGAPIFRTPDPDCSGADRCSNPGNQTAPGEKREKRKESEKGPKTCQPALLLQKLIVRSGWGRESVNLQRVFVLQVSKTLFLHSHFFFLMFSIDAAW